MSLQIDIIDETEGWAVLRDRQEIVKRSIEAAGAECGIQFDSRFEVSILLCDDETIRELNRNFRQLDKSTNVLSFPLPQMEDKSLPCMLGDIAISCQTVMREAVDEGKSFSDHTAHMVVHGFLHLLGFDHENKDDAEEMESRERQVLARLGIADPYAQFPNRLGQVESS